MRSQKEIEDMFRAIGLGTEGERNKYKFGYEATFLKTPMQKQIFIRFGTNTDLEGDEDAKLERDI